VQNTVLVHWQPGVAGSCSIKDFILKIEAWCDFLDWHSKCFAGSVRFAKW
jgi:hypothetical protein